MCELLRLLPKYETEFSGWESGFKTSRPGDSCTGTGLSSDTVAPQFRLSSSDRSLHEISLVWWFGKKKHVHKFFDTLPTRGDVCPPCPPEAARVSGTGLAPSEKPSASCLSSDTSWGALSCAGRSLTPRGHHVGGRPGHKEPPGVGARGRPAEVPANSWSQPPGVRTRALPADPSPPLS